MQWLKIIGGEARGKKFPLRDGIYSIGRDSSNQIQLDSSSVSRLHSIIRVSGKTVIIEDKNSANGTVINGEKQKKARLKKGDKIYLGKFVLELVTGESNDNVFDINTSAKKKASDYVIKENLERVAKISNQISWASRTFIILLLTSFLSGFFVIYFANSKIRGDLTAIALSKAKEHVKYLAEKNKLDLVNGNEMLLDVKDVVKEKWILDAVIIDKKGLILAPLKRQNQAEKNKYALEAVNIEKGQVITSHKYKGNLYVLAYPIRSYDNKKGRYQTIGAAKIIFSPDKLTETLPSGGSIPSIFALIVVLAAFVAFILIKKATLSPLKSIADKTEQAKIEGNFETESYPGEFLELAESIQRLASNLAILKSGEEQPSSPARLDAPTVLSNDKIDAILAVVPEPALIFDSKRTILSINEQAVFFFNLQSSSPLGMNIKDMIKDNNFSDAIEDLLIEADSSRDKIINKTIEEGLKTFEISVTGLRDQSGKIEFGILIVETI